MGRLENKTAFISGGARGIGAAIAVAYAKEGANVIINARSESLALEQTKTAIEDAGGNVAISLGNICDAGYVNTINELAAEHFGQIDILVNNAGVINDAPISFLKETAWDDVIEVNLKGAFLLSKTVIKPMVKRQSGRIINISSISAVLGREGQVIN